jgi:hypothetical protein
MTLRRAVARLRALFERRRLDDELENELAAHLELAERELTERGVPASDDVSVESSG